MDGELDEELGNMEDSKIDMEGEGHNSPSPGSQKKEGEGEEDSHIEISDINDTEVRL